MSSAKGASSLSPTNLNWSMKKIKCLKQVLRWYSIPSAMIWAKCEW